MARACRVLVDRYLGTGGDVNREQRKEEEMRPLRESGQGEAEVFEEAEAELIEHASHGDSGPDPMNLPGEPEAERTDADYGEADEFESSETPEADR